MVLAISGLWRIQLRNKYGLDQFSCGSIQLRIGNVVPRSRLGKVVLFRLGNLFLREGSVVSREGSVVAREGSVVPREGSVVPREGRVVWRLGRVEFGL